MVTHEGVPLSTLAESAGDLLIDLRDPADTEVHGVAYDSRKVASGDLFFCIPGTVTDGHDYAEVAVGSGASALCVERVLDLDIPQVVVSEVRRAMPRMAARFFGDPADALTIIGITGTNGKTTTAFLLEAILRADGRTTGLIGTIETRIGGEVQPGVRTTPESLDLQELFARMRDRGVDALAMEVTSHALVLHRVDDVRFAAVGFTNLSQDHLDFHSSMEDYFAAKTSLFLPERAATGAINVDDPYGRRLMGSAPIECIGFGMSEDADVRATAVKLEPSGTTLSVVTPRGDFEVATRLVGHFNVSNCLAATALALQAGIGLDAIIAGLGATAPVPGRFESVDGGQPFSVIVDYAHTPDSLDNVLSAARPLADANGGRVICAFGCGGDRDRGKRPLMGAVVARMADIVVVTSDNPRSEDPEAIIGAIIEGVISVRTEGPDATLADRGEAIRWALEQATPGDVVVIAGKGHETGQEFKDRTIPFDDRIVAREGLARLGYKEASA
ncbi:MAG: UDP-N-acetylmuramoyl-L-alanyl-D-glutamate--2,6-diaminopimelate ligase [Actinomycetota bacterium]|jgi:UDP-N-acetylmuramoyl-L-alanyl-D-glutamate--2,6-diaminopimelate ligase|nr:UDP-N-acetylmuramoyl-L-alanyl-D-glutamate--2,6-diaminopimelate ligase [Actinomycetota bacterium]